MTPDLGEYDHWLDTKLDHFDSFVLPEAVKRGMKVVLDMHEAPGKKNEFNEWNMLHDPAVARHFVETRRRIAKRFKGREGIYGYDLVNEPMQASEAAPGCDFWTLQKRAAEAIREIDQDVPIIVECNGQDSPWAFGCFSPFDMTNIIYQVHMYLPLAYTHQGVMWKQGDTYRSYPDESKGWNKEYLRAGLRPVREFQLRHGAKIYCGEFSAVAWAPGAGEYLRDCIDIFEEYGWDWCYHAFREWKGWSVEHEGPNVNGLVPVADNPRKQALLKGFRAR
ncbi:MAG: cellulase family glycosylhydrolase [Kiritimatiellae bacterium]|nr:cellulase family glycosylhydrolase [Kiritimatiellia bacterium]